MNRLENLVTGPQMQSHFAPYQSYRNLAANFEFGFTDGFGGVGS
jgi:hypothetical protein